MRRTFKIAKHEEYGYIGLAPTWMSDHQSDPLTGMGVAHDILEHGPKDIVEWQGLGGAVLVRGSGYFGRTRGNPDPLENIASDFVQLYHLWDGGDIPDPGRIPRLPNKSDEEMIVAVVLKGCRMIREEISYSRDDQEDNTAAQWTRPEQQRRMIGWMRKGYRACARRWARNLDTLTDTFRAIESAVDAFLPHHEDYEGADVIITFDPRTARVSIELDTEDDY